MSRLGEIDLPDRLAPALPRWATMLGVAFAAVASAAFVRVLLQLISPGTAPFALIYPAIMAATLFARWQSGLVTAILAIAGAWYFLYPVRNSWAFENADGAMTIASIAISALIQIVLAELFRRAVQNLSAERDRQIADRDLFLAEFDHRVKNNFTIVASMLDLQRRRATEPATIDALTQALTRVESIARAHRHLYGATATDMVDMHSYLTELCGALADALLLRGTIRLVCTADAIDLPRDRAVAIGLVINELVTNAAKHAFRGRDTGVITISLSAGDSGMVLTVADDGVGMTKEARASGRKGGLGQRLTEAFARQAGGMLVTESDARGTSVRVELAP